MTFFSSFLPTLSIHFLCAYLIWSSRFYSLECPMSQPHLKKHMQVESCNGEDIQRTQKEEEDASKYSYHGEDGQLARLFGGYNYAFIWRGGWIFD